MPWNPEIYNQFKAVRNKPFLDLMDLVSPEGLVKCVDIGCGTGEQTSLMAQRFREAVFLGIDSSVEMLSGSAKFEASNLMFKQQTIENFADDKSKWDLILSNAALQWSDDHAVLFPKLISKLNKHGQIAIQMPCQNDNVLNIILRDMIREKPFSDFLNGFERASPVLSIDQYAQIFFDEGLVDLQIGLKVYPIIASSEVELFNFISGSALIPYMDKLDLDQQRLLQDTFISRIKTYFKTFPSIYAFKRILLYGRKI